MSSEEEKYKQQVETAFYKTLNRHGYGFQYSVLNLAATLYDQTKSAWVLEAAEFPVEVKGSATRIDFVLRHRERPLYLLAECKRANPSISNWCFARAPFVLRNRSLYQYFYLEGVHVNGQESLRAFAKPRPTKEDTYHIALEVKSDEKGDATGTGRGAIEDAATQICRGLNGMVECLLNNVQILGKVKEASLLPVIFTTAQLWASDVDLSSADLESGNINSSKASFSNKSWLCYQYHLSPGLKHSSSSGKVPEAIGSLMESEYIRTIPIVSADGVVPFLEWSSNPDLWSDLIG